MLNPYFVSGLIDGEGSFTYWKQGGRVYPCFAIALNKRDRPLLEKVREFFNGMGELYTAKAVSVKYADGREYISGERVMFRVTRLAELMKIVWHFLDYPLEGQKAAAFQVWKDMVMVKAVNRPWERERLNNLAIELTQANGGKIKKPRKKAVVDTEPLVR